MYPYIIGPFSPIIWCHIVLVYNNLKLVLELLNTIEFTYSQSAVGNVAWAQIQTMKAINGSHMPVKKQTARVESNELHNIIKCKKLEILKRKALIIQFGFFSYSIDEKPKHFPELVAKKVIYQPLWLPDVMHEKMTLTKMVYMCLHAEKKGLVTSTQIIPNADLYELYIYCSIGKKSQKKSFSRYVNCRI